MYLHFPTEAWLRCRGAVNKLIIVVITIIIINIVIMIIFSYFSIFLFLEKQLQLPRLHSINTAFIVCVVCRTTYKNLRRSCEIWE